MKIAMILLSIFGALVVIFFLIFITIAIVSVSFEGSKTWMAIDEKIAKMIRGEK